MLRITSICISSKVENFQPIIRWRLSTLRPDSLITTRCARFTIYLGTLRMVFSSVQRVKRTPGMFIVRCFLPRLFRLLQPKHAVRIRGSISEIICAMLRERFLGKVSRDMFHRQNVHILKTKPDFFRKSFTARKNQSRRDRKAERRKEGLGRRRSRE